MTDRYENIRKTLAMGPTPGPWEPVTDRQYSDLPYLVLGAGSSGEKSTEWMPLYVHVGGRSGWMEQKANTLLIAACDPDTIRELLAERDQLAAEIDALRAEVERLSRYYKNGIDCFANPCERHSGERTPPFAEFFEKYGGQCLICVVDNNKALQAENERLALRDQEEGRE